MAANDQAYIRQWRDTLRAMRAAGGEPALPSGKPWRSEHDALLRRS